MTAFPLDWFWQIGGDASRYWSSKAGAYVQQAGDNFTRIANEAELTDVLRPYGLALPAPTVDDYKSAVQNLVDSIAISRQYTNGVSLVSYKDSSVKAWADEAAEFIAWRDQVWLMTYQTFAAVQSGQSAQPSIADLLAALSPPPWAA